MVESTTNDFLNEQQKEAVLSEDKRILVLAGAGSGKTKTLLQKIIYLIEEKGVSPSSILAITTLWVLCPYCGEKIQDSSL